MNALLPPILLPLAGAVLVVTLPRLGRLVGVLVAAGELLAVLLLGAALTVEAPLVYPLGGWPAPLGIGLAADGLALLFLGLVAVVGGGVSLAAVAYFPTASGFWPLWLFLQAGLNALFLAADVFNLYVTLELVGLAAVGLTALGGGRARVAALRYLLVGLLGSLGYLLGVALLYGSYGRLDLAGLTALAEPSPALRVALVAMVTGLLLKTAVFPLGFWLPPAHAAAPGPVSAALSALVVKAGFYVLLRLWFGPLAPAALPAVGQVLGGLGAAAVVWGGIQALRQDRLKLLVAYSTLSQLGYLMLVFPLARGAAAGSAVVGGVYFALAHGCAKGAMFLAAAAVQKAAGGDRLDQLDGLGQRLPLAGLAFGFAVVSLLGLPPSGGFIAKWSLLQAAVLSGQWWWVPVIVVGTLLGAAYALRVIGPSLAQPQAVRTPLRAPPGMLGAALLLAAAALSLGPLAGLLSALLGLGAPSGPALRVAS